MIKFFRKIRQKLLVENRFSKYLLYAFGEIILVVIGILIALQINNWNEKVKKEEKIQVLLNDVFNELHQNIISSVDKLPYFHEKDSVFRAIMFKKVTKEVYLNEKYLQFKYMMNNSRKVVLSEESFDVLIANLDEVPIHYKAIIKDLIHLNNDLKKDVDTWNIEFDKEFRNYVKFESENYEWFSEYSEKGNQPIIDYYLNDHKYKNRVAYMYDVVIQNLFSNSLKYRKEAITTYIKLAKILNKKLKEENIPWFIKDANVFVGNYQLQTYIKNGFIWGQKQPDENIKIFKNEKGLKLVSEKDSNMYDIISFSKHQFIAKNIIFCTLKTQGKDTIIETNGGAIYKKINFTND